MTNKREKKNSLSTLPSKNARKNNLTDTNEDTENAIVFVVHVNESGPYWLRNSKFLHALHEMHSFFSSSSNEISLKTHL